VPPNADTIGARRSSLAPCSMYPGYMSVLHAPLAAAGSSQVNNISRVSVGGLFHIVSAQTCMRSVPRSSATPCPAPGRPSGPAPWRLSLSDADTVMNAGPCALCGRNLLLCVDGAHHWVVCSGDPLCRLRVHFPAALTRGSLAAQTCQSCTHGSVRCARVRSSS
jgi:hypothetical protein